MTTEKGESLGDSTKDCSHIESHIEEGYAVPSLVFRALKERGYGPLVLSMAFGKCGSPCGIRGMVKKSVAKYVFKRFGMAGK